MGHAYPFLYDTNTERGDYMAHDVYNYAKNLEPAAVEHLQQLAALPAFRNAQVCMMPDAHGSRAV